MLGLNSRINPMFIVFERFSEKSKALLKVLNGVPIPVCAPDNGTSTAGRSKLECRQKQRP
jgi:hypothetical protein